MPKIDKWIIDRVMSATNIVDVVGESVTLRKAGVNMTGLCPFHEDRHIGNFIVTPKGSRKHANKYHCFVCGADGDSVDFLMKHEGLTYPDAIRYLGKKYCIEVDGVAVNYTPPPPKPQPPPPPLMEIERKWVRGLMKRNTPTNFTRWLYTLPWQEAERKRLPQTLWQYCVAGWRDGRVVFWQIDHDGVPRSAKLMRYHDDGHRDKDEHPGWIYNQGGIYDEQHNYKPGPRDILKPESHTILKPLFGSHLLKAYPEAAVNVVESEKTAIIMANYYGEPERNVWLACGGLKFLKTESLQPLIDQGRTVWLWPDRDGVEKWQELCEKMGYEKMRVYTRFFDTHYVAEDDGPKADIADIAIRIMGGGRLPERKQDTGDGQGATEKNATADDQSGATPAPTPDTSWIGERPEGVTDEEWAEHIETMTAISEYIKEHPEEEPF